MPISSDFISNLLDAFRITLIPDGDNQPRTSEQTGETFVLSSGDTSETQGAPVVTLDDDRANVLLLGAARSLGDTAAIELGAKDNTLAVFPSGSVFGERDGVLATGASAKVLNAGAIFGGVNGVRLLGEDGYLVNFGEISSDSRAVDIVGSGAVLRNFGDVLGTGDQRNGTVYADNEAEDITILNGRTGVIDAGKGNNGAGISLELGDVKNEAVEANIFNHGEVIGRGDAPQGENTRGDGIRLFSGVEGGGTAFDGKIVNSGLIASEEARGIEIRDGLGVRGEILNSGTIFGATDGLYFGDAQHDALVVNKGHILSNSRAVNIDGAGVVLANHGRIAGTDDQRNGTVYADNTADEYTILNHKGGVIDAGYGNNGSAISLQTGDSKGDVVFADVVNHGLVRGRGDAEEGNGIGDGVRLFSGVEDAVFQGSVVNHGRILASKESDAAVGIRVEDGVRLDGGIVNHGRIFGSETAIDASDAAPDIAVKNAGVIIGDVVLTDGNDLFDGAHGRVNGVVSGGAGADALIGGRRGDTLAGGAGDDDLTGNGGADIFVFAKEDAPSKDIVNDFEDGRDRIDVSDFGFKSVAEIGVEQLGDNLRLTFDADNSVLLKDTSADQITSDDFIF